MYPVMAVKRSKPGEIREAIMTFLRSRTDGASVANIHAGVESFLKRQVPASSIRSYLRLNVGTYFEKPRRGHYRLKAR